MKQEPNLKKNPLNPLQEILDPAYWRESTILHLLPAAAYVCDLSGVIKNYNEEAVKLWGRKPMAGERDDQLFSTYEFFDLNGTPLPQGQVPLTASLSDGRTWKDLEIIIQRPGVSQIVVSVTVVPIKDDKGNPAGVFHIFKDITKQKKTEKELKTKTRELQDYVDNAAIGLHWVDADGIIIWANKSELNMLGYSEEEYIGHHISEFHVQPEIISDILHRLNCNETLDQYESVMRCKDGSTKTVHITSNVLWEEGKFVHTRCFTVDVTERKKLFNALQESEERLRQIIRSLPVAIYTCNKEGYITLYNEAAAELWGRTPDIGKDLWCGSWKINKPDGAPLPLDSCPMAVCLKEGRPVYGEEILIRKPDGQVRNVVPHPQPLFDTVGEITGAVNMLLDVTEAKQTEKALLEKEERYRQLALTLEKTVEAKTLDLSRKNEELKKSEERYHKMVEEVEDYAIILLDISGIVQNWNKGAEKIKGYKEGEIVGKSFRLFYLPEDREKGTPELLLQRAREKGKAVHEGWRVRSDGTRFWGSIVLTALHDKENNVIGFSKVTRDLTERKLAEDKIRDYANQLKFQNEQLEQFAYAASHDMKEPLRKILFYNNHLLETESIHLPDKEKEYLGRSIKAANRMKALIDDLLEYSKASLDAREFETVDLNELIDEIVQSHRDAVEEKGAAIHFSFLPVIKGVPFQLRQLFDNLISNGVKYHHPERKPKVNISAEKISGDGASGLDQQKEYYKITVSDNGIGFDAEYSEKIFELFHRLPGVSKYSGTGVGLTLCKKIVQNHYGVIKAVGRLNEGADFEVYLPV
jgi:PAS domain S-box-containing protein